MKSQRDDLVLYLIGAGLIVLLSAGCAASSEKQMQTPTETAAMAQVTAQPIDTPSTAPPAAEGAVLALAEAGVTHNADWTPYTEEISGVLMALVPAGCFQMGTIAGNSSERPVHEVCFDEPFWIDVYEVTNEEYGSIDCADFSDLPDQPRVCLQWTEALEYCQARGGRLPTDAEWEYSARGPDGLVYPWGNEFDEDNAVWGINSGRNAAAVGSRPEGVSWIGAYDMIGNVWEWVNDWYSGNYYETLGERVVNPQGPRGGTWHGRRGSSFLYEQADALRASFREHVPWEAVDDGVRCARSYSP